MITQALDMFTLAYIECALWSTTDESTPQGGEPLDSNYTLDDIAPEALEKMAEDCRQFQEANAADLVAAEYHSRWPDTKMAGHDFWLTRNGHGAGFWSRNLGDVGGRLTEAARRFGEVCLYVDDGRIYCL